MKGSSKILICIGSVCVILACVAGVYLINATDKNDKSTASDSNVNIDTSIDSDLNVSNIINNIDNIKDGGISFNSNAVATDSDAIVDTSSVKKDEFSLWEEEFNNNNLWEKEFNNCAETMMNNIEQWMSDKNLTIDEKIHRLEIIEMYSASWLAYKSFVTNWVQREGSLTQLKAREEIFKQATLLMVLIADNYGGYSRESYEFIYDHGSSREALLSAGNEALQMENVIDESAKIIEEEFEEIDHYSERIVLEADAWEAEFHNCMEKYSEMFYKTYRENEYEEQVLRLWGDFVELWAENDAEIEALWGAGSGLRVFMAKRKRECYRTATLLMIYQMEQNGIDYEFIYNIEADRDFFRRITERYK